MKNINFKHLIRLYKINRLSGYNIFQSAYLTLRGKIDSFGLYLWEGMNEHIEEDLELEWWDSMKESLRT